MQFLDILESYFRHAALYHPNAADPENNAYLSSAAGDFLYTCANFLSRLKPTPSVFSRHQDLLRSLSSILRSAHTGVETDSPPDYLFFASLLHVTRLLTQRTQRSEIITTETGRELILAIFEYRSRFHPRNDMMEMMSSWNETPPVLDSVWYYFVAYAEDLGIVLLPIAGEGTDLPPVECADVQEEIQHTSGDGVVDFGRIVDQVARDDASTHLSQEDDGWATT